MRQDKRNHFRIKFPIGFRPTVSMDMGTFEVIDLSEFGIKFDGEQIDWTPYDKPMEMVISFPGGDSKKVEGKVLRIANNEVVVLLSIPVPWRKIVELQRAIIQRERYTRY